MSEMLFADDNTLQRRGVGERLADLELPLGEPSIALTKMVWTLGRHTLVVAELETGHSLWAPLLVAQPSALFALFPTPMIALRDLDKVPPLIMLQPDAWLARHLLDTWRRVRPDEWDNAGD